MALMELPLFLLKHPLGISHSNKYCILRRKCLEYVEMKAPSAAYPPNIWLFPILQSEDRS
jgi:hypothetical protein